MRRLLYRAFCFGLGSFGFGMVWSTIDWKVFKEEDWHGSMAQVVGMGAALIGLSLVGLSILVAGLQALFEEMDSKRP